MTLAIADLCHGGRALRPLARTLGVALVCGSAALCSAAGTADRSPAHIVIIEGVAYRPAVVAVRRGDTVSWVNNDPFPHTVTAPGAFDSHDIPAGATWNYVARKSGQYAYICTLHPNMKGVLKVR